jgi:homoserine O-acetyltransferase
MGISMGGMQTFAWMTQHPEFMNKAVAIAGTPRLTPQDRLLWQAELRAFRTACRASDTRRQAMRTISAIHSLHLQTPAKLARMDSSEARKFIGAQESDILKFDPYDWAWQLKAMLRHDITDPFGNSLERTADAVEADAIVVTVQQDHMVNPIPAQRFAETLGAKDLRPSSFGTTPPSTPVFSFPFHSDFAQCIAHEFSPSYSLRSFCYWRFARLRHRTNPTSRRTATQICPLTGAWMTCSAG